MAEAKRRLTIELLGEQRSDGCYHLKSPDLPGFHFIVGPEEKASDFEGPLMDALRTFVPVYLKAQSQRSEKEPIRSRITRARLNLTAELEVA